MSALWVRSEFPFASLMLHLGVAGPIFEPLRRCCSPRSCCHLPDNGIFDCQKIADWELSKWFSLLPADSDEICHLFRFHTVVNNQINCQDAHRFWNEIVAGQLLLLDGHWKKWTLLKLFVEQAYWRWWLRQPNSLIHKRNRYINLSYIA